MHVSPSSIPNPLPPRAFWFTLALSILLLAGCGREPKATNNQAPDGSAGGSTGSGSGGASSAIGGAGGGAAAPSSGGSGGSLSSGGQAGSASGGAPSTPDSYPLPPAPVVDLTSAVRWSDPATWGGELPAAGDDVSIPAGKVVLLDMDVVVSQLHVHGTLACDPEKDESLRAAGILVHGAFVCGTQAAPYEHRFTVTLASAPADDMEASGLVVMDGGVLALFGEPRRGWTQLARTALAGDAEISVLEPLGFRPKDRLVLASTDFDPYQAEEVVVKTVDGTKLTLEEPLRWMHWGELQTYPSDVKGAPSVLDERGEVALLSRNIVIQGDASAEDTHFGAHVMTMGDGRMYVQGVELNRVGQKSRLGRYPLHWHHAGDATGQFIADSSIHHSFNRCVTIHATQNATVLRNVCYDHIGHGYFLEDGIETGNLLAYNLGIATRTALPGEEVLLSDRADLGISAVGKAAGPATFWIANADNTLAYNRAAGSDGSGFWYPPKPRPTGDSAGMKDYVPYEFPVREFKGNVSHSSQIGLLLGFAQEQDGNQNDWYFGPEQGTAIFDTFTSYKILGEIGGQAGNVWLRGGAPIQFRNMVSADSRHHYNFAYDAVLDGALLVGQSRNIGNPTTDAEKKAGRTTPWHEEVGFGLYDGPHHLKNVYFTGFTPNPFGPDPDGLAATAAIVEVNGAFTGPDHSAQGVAFAPDTVRFHWGAEPSANVSLLDVDGSVTGHAGWYVTGRNPVMRDDRCLELQTSPSAVYACPGPELSTVVQLPNANAGDGTITRLFDGAQAVVTRGGYQTNVLSGYDYKYSFQNPGNMPDQVNVRIDPNSTRAGNWVTIEVPVPWEAAFVYPWESGDVSADTQAPALAPQADVDELEAAGTGYARSANGFTFKLVVPGEGAGVGLRACRTQGCN